MCESRREREREKGGCMSGSEGGVRRRENRREGADNRGVEPGG